jgi:hypothetical protein
MPLVRAPRASDGYQRIWLVYGTGNLKAEDRAVLDVDFELVREISYQQSGVALYQAR